MKNCQKIRTIKKTIIRAWLGAAISLSVFWAGTVPAYAGWEYDASGWWFQNSDGTYPVGSWKEIDNQWYYFDANGYMAVGWVQSGGNWYYCNPDGSLAVNCWINGTYYIGSNGAMYVDRTTPDGYRVGADGAYIQEVLSQTQVEAIYQQKLNQCKLNYGAEYLMEDFNQDGIKDLLLFQNRRMENVNDPIVKAELYTIINGNLTLCDTMNENLGGFGVSRKNGYVLLSFSTSYYSDYIYSITPSLTFMQEVNYTTHTRAGENGQIYENANHIYSGYIYATDIDRGKSISMISLSKN